jgi:cutinase
MMKFLTTLSMIVAASATPVTIPASGDALVATRQLVLDRTSLTENEFSRLIGGGCKNVIFVWARGSTELGNMVILLDRDLLLVLTLITRDLSLDSRSATNFAASTALTWLSKAWITQLCCLPTIYLAVLTSSLSSRCAVSWRTSTAAALRPSSCAVVTREFCPLSEYFDHCVLTNLHRQGAAVNHRAIEDLSTSVKNQIAGVVTFGDTQARADNQQIPNFPRDKLKIFCGGVIRDTVCDGNLAGAVLAPHLSYGRNAGEAGEFLIGKINAVRQRLS